MSKIKSRRILGLSIFFLIILILFFSFYKILSHGIRIEKLYLGGISLWRMHDRLRNDQFDLYPVSRNWSCACHIHVSICTWFLCSSLCFDDSFLYHHHPLFWSQRVLEWFFYDMGNCIVRHANYYLCSFYFFLLRYEYLLFILLHHFVFCGHNILI